MNFAARKFLSASHRERVSTGGEVANALVCKTSIRRFNPGPVLHTIFFELSLICLSGSGEASEYFA